jgi:hypothetical protein
MGISASPESIIAQECYLLSQNKTLLPSTVVTKVLLTPRQTLGLLLLAKYTHLNKIRVYAEEKQQQEEARRKALMSNSYLHFFRFHKYKRAQDQTSEDINAISNQELDAVAVFQDTTSIIDCEELGSTPETRVRVMRLARRWRAKALGEQNRLGKARAWRVAQIWRAKAMKGAERQREETNANKICLRRAGSIGEPIGSVSWRMGGKNTALSDVSSPAHHSVGLHGRHPSLSLAQKGLQASRASEHGCSGAELHGHGKSGSEQCSSEIASTHAGQEVVGLAGVVLQQLGNVGAAESISSRCPSYLPTSTRALASHFAVEEVRTHSESSTHEKTTRFESRRRTGSAAVGEGVSTVNSGWHRILQQHGRDTWRAASVAAGAEDVSRSFGDSNAMRVSSQDPNVARNGIASSGIALPGNGHNHLHWQQRLNWQMVGCSVGAAEGVPNIGGSHYTLQWQARGQNLQAQRAVVLMPLPVGEAERNSDDEVEIPSPVSASVPGAARAWRASNGEQAGDIEGGVQLVLRELASLADDPVWIEAAETGLQPNQGRNSGPAERPEDASGPARLHNPWNRPEGTQNAQEEAITCEDEVCRRGVSHDMVLPPDHVKEEAENERMGTSAGPGHNRYDVRQSVVAENMEESVSFSGDSRPTATTAENLHGTRVVLCAPERLSTTELASTRIGLIRRNRVAPNSGDIGTIPPVDAGSSPFASRMHSTAIHPVTEPEILPALPVRRRQTALSTPTASEPSAFKSLLQNVGNLLAQELEGMLSGPSTEIASPRPSRVDCSASAAPAHCLQTENQMSSTGKTLRWYGDGVRDGEGEGPALTTTLSSQQSGLQRKMSKWADSAQKATGFNVSALATRLANSEEPQAGRLHDVIEVAAHDPVVLAQNLFLAQFAQVCISAWAAA